MILLYLLDNDGEKLLNTLITRLMIIRLMMMITLLKRLKIIRLMIMIRLMMMIRVDDQVDDDSVDDDDQDDDDDLVDDDQFDDDDQIEGVEFKDNTSLVNKKKNYDVSTMSVWNAITSQRKYRMLYIQYSQCVEIVNGSDGINSISIHIKLSILQCHAKVSSFSHTKVSSIPGTQKMPQNKTDFGLYSILDIKIINFCLSRKPFRHIVHFAKHTIKLVHIVYIVLCTVYDT